MTVDADSLVRFGRNEHDRITVHVPETHRPVMWVIHDQPTWGWPEILQHAHHPEAEYLTGGNLYDITIEPAGVTISDQLDESVLTTISHRDFITIVEGYLAELDHWYAERGITTEQRHDLHHPTENPTGKPYHQLWPLLPSS